MGKRLENKRAVRFEEKRMRETPTTAPHETAPRDTERLRNGDARHGHPPAGSTTPGSASTGEQAPEDTVPAQFVTIQIGEINIVHQCGGHYAPKGDIMTPDEEEDMESVESPEVNGGRLISVTEAMTRSGIGRTTIHKALKYIRHARWKDTTGKRDVVLLYEDSFNEWLKAPAPIRRASPGGQRAEGPLPAAS